MLPVRVVDDQVRVRPDGDRALARVHPEQLRRRGRDDLDPALLRDLPADDAAVVQQVEPVLDARQAVRDLPEVALAEVLLAVEVERAVVRRDDLEVVLRRGRVQSSGLVVLRPERRRADELRALEAVAHVVERQEEVLRARLGEGRRSPASRAAPDLVQRLRRGQVDDVDGHLGRLARAGSRGSSPRPRRSRSARGRGRSGRSCRR